MSSVPILYIFSAVSAYRASVKLHRCVWKESCAHLKNLFANTGNPNSTILATGIYRNCFH